MKVIPEARRGTKFDIYVLWYICTAESISEHIFNYYCGFED
jgi:hypothetical protein